MNNPLNTVLQAQLHKNLVQIVSHEALRPQIKKILDDLTCWWPCVCVAAGVQAQPPPPVAMTSRRSCSRETGSRRETTNPILRNQAAIGRWVRSWSGQVRWTCLLLACLVAGLLPWSWRLRASLDPTIVLVHLSFCSWPKCLLFLVHPYLRQCNLFSCNILIYCHKWN